MLEQEQLDILWEAFKDLGQYRFDFYINDKYLIEYDGI